MVLLVVVISAIAYAQSTPATNEPNSAEPASSGQTLTIPPGTHLPLVLTQPIQSRHIHRGDDIYAQVTAPVDAANQVAIPPGTFVQGTVDKIGRRNGRGEVRLQSMSITFPDGYIAPIAGPITLESDEGYALKDPGSNRSAAMFILPAAGFGVGALIGHSIGGSPTTITSTLPPGCTGVPPECLTSSVTGPSNTGVHTAIGAGVGGAIGMAASLAIFLGSHHFFLDVGTPMGMTLQHPVILQQAEVSRALQQSAQGPVAVQPVAPLPTPPPPPDIGPSMSPATPPGTPPTVIPGPPGPAGVPGAPIIIPGTPPGM